MIEPIVKSVGGIEVHKGVVVVTGDLSRFLCLKSEGYELVQCEICKAPGERSMEILWRYPQRKTGIICMDIIQ